MISTSSFHILRFDRAASRYEGEARIQTGMADRLLSLWDEPKDPKRILELGCGTGLLTRRLRIRFPDAPILATDAAPRMLEMARKRCAGDAIRFESCDAEGLTDPPAFPGKDVPFDLLASNALIQWFPDLAAHLRFAAKLAAPGGAYLLSGFARSNFPELNALLAEPPFSYREFPGHDTDGLRAATKTSGWDLIALQSWEVRETLPSPLAALKRIQALGSSRDPRAGGRLNRKKLSWLLSEYETRYKTEGGVSLTWKPWAARLVRVPHP